MDRQVVPYSTGPVIGRPYHQQPISRPPTYSPGGLSSHPPDIPPGVPPVVTSGGPPILPPVGSLSGPPVVTTGIPGINPSGPPGSPPPNRPGSPLDSSSVSSQGFRSTILSRVHVGNMFPSRRSGGGSNPKKSSSTRRAIEQVEKDPEVIHRLPLETLLKLPEQLFNELEPRRLQGLPKEVLAKVSVERLMLVPDLQKLPPSTLARLPAACLVDLGGDVLKALAYTKPEKMAEVLSQFPWADGKLHDAALRELQRIHPENFVNLPPPVLARLYESSPKFFHERIPPDAWRSLSAAQESSLPPEILPIAQKARRSGQGQDNQAAVFRPPQSISSTQSTRSAQSTQSTISALPMQSDFNFGSFFEPSGTWGQSTPSTSISSSPLPMRPLPSLPQSVVVQPAGDPRLGDLKKELDDLRREKTDLDRQIGSLISEKQFLADEKGRLEQEKKVARQKIFDFLRNNKVPVDETGNAEHQLLNFASQMSKQSGENWTAYKYWYDEGTKFKEQITALEAGTADLQLRLQRTTEACQTLKEKQVNHERTKVELGRYRNEYAELEMRCQQAEGTYKQKLAAETHDLKVQLETVEAQHRQMMHEATTKLGQEKQTLAQEIRTLQEENARNIQKWEESRQNELHTLQEHFQGQVNEVQRGFENELARKEELHQLEIKDLKERVRSLESSLVDNSDDFRPATDDLLKNSYEQLSLAIETITHNLRVVDFPRSSNLDPDGFLQTHERTEAKFLLRSVIWQQIRNGFFCSPFGLGALGPGEGKRRLLELWIQYRRLIGGSPPPTVSIPLGEYDVPAVEKDSIDVFRSDKEANKWRSSTFQAIMSALKSANSKDHLGGGVITPYFNNRDQIHDNILSILDQVAPGSITEDIGDKVSKLIDRAGELALQFGMQRAELGLRGAIKGVQMAIGRDFIDCYDDDGQGEVKEVVLTITPMCYKAGDGRNDLHTPKVMAQGMIYSVRSL